MSKLFKKRGRNSCRLSGSRFHKPFFDLPKCQHGFTFLAISICDPRIPQHVQVFEFQSQRRLNFVPLKLSKGRPCNVIVILSRINLSNQIKITAGFHYPSGSKNQEFKPASEFFDLESQKPAYNIVKGQSHLNLTLIFFLK